MKNMEMKKKIKNILFILAIFTFPGASQALTSVAGAPEKITETNYVTHNYSSQKEADKDALEGCRVNARTNGVSDFSKKCKILDRADVPGFGAIDCGDTGCGWSMQNSDAQEAVDSAYTSCTKHSTNCAHDNITYWDDEAGFHQKLAAKSQSTQSCRPQTSNIRCHSQCTNGSCIITYENGCKMRVQVQPQYNPLNNTWEYSAPAC